MLEQARWSERPARVDWRCPGVEGTATWVEPAGVEVVIGAVGGWAIFRALLDERAAA